MSNSGSGSLMKQIGNIGNAGGRVTTSYSMIVSGVVSYIIF